MHVTVVDEDKVRCDSSHATCLNGHIRVSHDIDESKVAHCSLPSVLNDSSLSRDAKIGRTAPHGGLV